MHSLKVMALSGLLTFGTVGVPVYETTEGFGMQYNEAEARRGGGGFSGGGRSFSRSSPSRGGGMKFSGGGGGKKTGAIKTPGRAAKSSKTGSVPRKQFASLPQGKQNLAGKANLKNARAKMKPPVPPTGVAKGTKLRPGSPKTNDLYRNKYKDNALYKTAGTNRKPDYWQRRNNQYDGWDRPRYYDSSPSSIGMFDMFAVAWMYDMMTPDQVAQFNHGQQNNPDWLLVQAELNRLSADNAELRAKMAAVNGVAVSGAGDPNFVPKGIDADLILSPEAAASVNPDFNMCVGGKGNPYHRASIAVQLGTSTVNIRPVHTAGSGETLDKIESGECDGGFLQADAYWNRVEENKGLNVHVANSPFTETVHLVCHGDQDLSDLGKGTTVYFPKGSGAEETWKNFVAEEKGLKAIRTILTDKTLTVASNEDAVMKTKSDKNGCFMYVGVAGSGSFAKLMSGVADKYNLSLVDFDMSDLFDSVDPAGAKVYSGTEFGGVYDDTLERDRYLDVDSLSVNTDIVFSRKWMDANPALATKLELEIDSLKDTIVSAVAPK